MLRQTMVALLLSAGAVTAAHAQWLNYPAAAIPRAKEGKPNLSARAPRAADGKPDLSGVWTTDPTP